MWRNSQEFLCKKTDRFLPAQLCTRRRHTNTMDFNLDLKHTECSANVSQAWKAWCQWIYLVSDPKSISRHVRTASKPTTQSCMDWGNQWGTRSSERRFSIESLIFIVSVVQFWLPQWEIHHLFFPCELPSCLGCRHAKMLGFAPSKHNWAISRGILKKGNSVHFIKACRWV